MGLTSDQVSLIKSTVPILRQYGKIITTTFYDNMLSDHPELNDIFNRTNQVNGHQASALAGSLYAYASHIDDLGVLAPAVEKIVQKHASLYIQPEQYDLVGYYLLKAMKIVLGDALTEDIQSAVRISSFQYSFHGCVPLKHHSYFPLQLQCRKTSTIFWHHAFDVVPSPVILWIDVDLTLQIVGHRLSTTRKPDDGPRTATLQRTPRMDQLARLHHRLQSRRIRRHHIFLPKARR